MEYPRLLQICIFFRVLLLSSAIIFRYGPTDTVMAVGKTAVLQCAVSYQNNHEIVSWFHVETNQILSHDDSVLAMEDRFSVIGNRDGKGEYYLTIRNVQRSDEGEYRCISGPEYRAAQLKVILPPPQDYPLCDVEPGPTANKPGDVTKLSCTSHGGHPPARLTWKRHDIIISPTIAHVNKLQRVVYEEDNGVPYVCYAASAALDYPRTCRVMVLNIPPTADIKPLEQEVRAGDTATFECFGYGMPEVTSYQWFVNYSPVKTSLIPRYSVDKTNQTLTISNVRRWEHGSLIICEVCIKSGLKGRGTARLNVHTTPVTVGNGKTKPKPTLAPTALPNVYPRPGRPIHPTGRIHSGITRNTGALIGSIVGTLLLLTIVLFLTCMVLRAKLNQMGVEIIPFCKGTNDKSPDGDNFPIYAQPNKIRKEKEAPPLPDAPRPLTRMATLPPRVANNPLEPIPKRKVKKHYSNYERIDLVPRRVSFLETKMTLIKKMI
ncbi:protein sax-3-like [Amphiura filiformis]|uniref:protein sax-3-like n=1 Tax=Amphiura filiformis TaxID=82378 RepID=UPI003B2263AC